MQRHRRHRRPRLHDFDWVDVFCWSMVGVAIAICVAFLLWLLFASGRVV